MKKNITINLFGILYAIDEDAYELLSRYLNDMKKHFSRQEGGEEIADDIEHRVSELMQELQQQGIQAITIEHIKGIIERIGNPEEVDNESSDTEQTVKNKFSRWFQENIGKKKLFRNPQDKILGGIISGLGCYLNINATWLRLLTVILTCILGGPILLAYLILWVIVPEATTTEDRLNMQGKPVNMENLRQEIMDGTQKVADTIGSPQTKSKAEGCLNSTFNLLATLIKGFFFMILIIVLFSCGITIMALLAAICWAIFDYRAGTWSTTTDWVHNGNVTLFNYLVSTETHWIVAISLLVALILIIYLGGHFLLRQIGKAKPMGKTAILYLVVLFASLSIFCASIISTQTQFQAKRSIWRELSKARRDSIEVQNQINWLADNGWEVIKHEHCEGRYVRSGEHYSNDRTVQYIDAWSDHPNMEYTVERTVRVSPGTYRLEAVGRTNGEGPEIYAFSKNGRLSATIPNFGNIAGNIWEEASDSLATNPNNPYYQKRHEIHKKKGYGWSRISIDNIVVTDSILRYGVSNRSETGYWNGRWFSACDFVLKKVK